MTSMYPQNEEKYKGFSGEIVKVKEEVVRLQVWANQLGRNMDFESILIGLECHIETAKKYEALEQ